MRLLLLRHGRTAWNDAGRFQGQADPPLDSTGQAQAAGVAPVIQALHPDLVVSSDLRRCQATAAAIGLPYESDPRLREIDLGAWSGLDAVEVSRRFPEQDAAWRRGEDVRRGGGETYSEVAARAGELFDELVTAGRPATPNGLIVFVLHSGTARSLIGHLLGLPPDAWWHFGPIGNCRWSLLRREHGRFRLSAHNVGLTPADSVRPGTSAAAAGTLLPTQEPPTATDDEPVHSPRQH